MTGYCIPYFCYSFSHFYVEQLRNDKLSIDEDELQEVRGIMGNIALGYRTYLHSYRILPRVENNRSPTYQCPFCQSLSNLMI